ncbi:MAG: trehalose-phosphatase [Candidatus Omnitrophota bacterium]|nr:trehalose-phosphatase [Candidatus Omnitrophota bacterium]
MKTLSAGWPEIRERVRAAEALALFLDYDGTLTPIVRHPSQARLAEGTRRLLRKLSCEKGIWVAVVSGRALEDVRRMTGVARICYVGNHGLELEGPNLRYVNPMAKKCRPVLRRIVRRLKEAVAPIPGAWIEDKGFTLTLHFRQAAPAGKKLARGLFQGVVRPYREKKQVRITAGKEVFEVRPPVRWTKGTAVSWLLDRRAALSPGPVLPIYIGDDLTDEDAFRALGKRGISVAVGAGNPLTRAQYRVRSPAEVGSFLRRLLLISERSADRAGRRDQRRVQRNIARSA